MQKDNQGEMGESIGSVPSLGRPVRVFSRTTSLPFVSRSTAADPSDPMILVALPKVELVRSISENALNGLLERVVVEEWRGPSVTIIVDSLRSLQVEITGLQVEVRNLTASDTAKTAAIATLTASDTAKTAAIATLTASDTAKTAAIATLTASDTAKTAAIATLNGDIATLNGDIATLTAKIEAISSILDIHR
jgi:cell division protein FtsB